MWWPLHFISQTRLWMWWPLHFISQTRLWMWWPLHFISQTRLWMWWPLHFISQTRLWMWWPFHFISLTRLWMWLAFHIISLTRWWMWRISTSFHVGSGWGLFHSWLSHSTTGVGPLIFSRTTTGDVWIIPSFRVWGYVLHIEHLQFVITNWDEHQSVIFSLLLIVLYALLDENITRE